MTIMEISETFEHRVKKLLAVLPLAGPAEQAAVVAAVHNSGPRAIRLEWIAAQIQDNAEERSALRKRYEELNEEFLAQIRELVKAVD